MGTALADLTIAWFEENARDLPWRHPSAGAWGVLVSEFMLQQTPVVRVEPVWRSWMTRWPTPADLAAEPAAEAIRAWGRLGYPRRAIRLHACAVAIRDGHDGKVPSGVEQLLALPGIGAYTARAVVAFAYGQRTPVVDTNVRRMVARAVTGAADAGPATTLADLTLVESLLPPEPARAARASAAFMELGALLCTARSPRCHDCPLWSCCAWRLSGQPPATGPSRRPQTYAGTDRQVRGELLAILRDATGPVPLSRLDLAWPTAEQRDRALSSLVTDGLLVEHSDGWYALAGEGGLRPVEPGSGHYRT
jgi:A/G-specific adenine glycosylase